MSSHDDREDGLTPEQQKQVDEAMARARTALRGLGGFAGAGLLRTAGRGFLRSFVRLPRIRGRRLAFLVIGLAVALLSVATCSAGVSLRSLTSEYGEPVPATIEAAQRLVQRTATSVQAATASRRFRITMTEAEATSALSLGLLIPELMQALDTIPAERLREAKTIEELRAVLRERESAQREGRPLGERLTGVLDPRLRTGDVQVRFTGDGHIVMAGYVQAWRWQQPALAVFAPRAGAGRLELHFVRGRLGRLPAPSWAFDRLGGLLASLILQGRDYAEITDITVEAGRFTFEAALSR